MASGEVKLIGTWISPFVIRAAIALNIKSVDYEFLEEVLIRSKSQLLRKCNPVYKTVPVLIHGDKPICESILIVQYIDEVWASSGPSILPPDPHDRATARFLAAYIDDKCILQVKALLLADGEEARSALVKELKQVMVLLEEAFIKCSKGQKFFSGGDKIGFLDIVLGSCLSWMRMIQNLRNVNLIEESECPNLFKWAQDFSADDAVMRVPLETDRLVQFAKLLISKSKASGNH